MGAFGRLSDSVLHRIRDYQLNEEDDDQKKKIKAAQLLVERIAERRLYTLVHSVKNYKQEDMVLWYNLTLWLCIVKWFL